MLRVFTIHGTSIGDIISNFSAADEMDGPLEFTHFLASAGPTLAKAAEFNSDQQGSRADA